MHAPRKRAKPSEASAAVKQPPLFREDWQIKNNSCCIVLVTIEPFVGRFLVWRNTLSMLRVLSLTGGIGLKIANSTPRSSSGNAQVDHPLTSATSAKT